MARGALEVAAVERHEPEPVDRPPGRGLAADLAEAPDALLVERDGAVVLAERVRDRAEVVERARDALGLARLAVERDAQLEVAPRVLEVALVVGEHPGAVERVGAQG